MKLDNTFISGKPASLIMSIYDLTGETASKYSFCWESDHIQNILSLFELILQEKKSASVWPLSGIPWSTYLKAYPMAAYCLLTSNIRKSEWNYSCRQKEFSLDHPHFTSKTHSHSHPNPGEKKKLSFRHVAAQTAVYRTETYLKTKTKKKHQTVIIQTTVFKLGIHRAASRIIHLLWINCL